MRDEFVDKGYREAFVEENIKNGIAFQVSALREKRGWTQTELGARAGKPQNVVSRIENPDYGKFTIRTLLDIAAAFDVALLVKFVSYGDLLAQMRNLTPKALAVPNFEEEQEVSSTRWDSVAELTAPKYGNSNRLAEDADKYSRPREESGAFAAVCGRSLAHRGARLIGRYEVGGAVENYERQH